jgi:flagellar hook-associated protein 2
MKGGADMPISLTTLQVYDQYLTTYRSKDTDSTGNKTNKRSARYSTHDTSELQDVYSSIQWKNRFAPLYLTEPTPKSIAYAVHLKESANSLKQTIDSLSGQDEDMFSMKSAYSDNEKLASVEYVPEDAEDDTPQDFDLTIENFATPQVNTGKYLSSDQPVGLTPDSYSFDLLTNKLHYELQFNVNEGETNSQLQNKLSRLINDSNIGVSAKVVETHGHSALEITSDALGLPYQGERHFTITDENTSYSKGVVDYLGLNKSIKEATNAVYTINGDEESSYSNSFSVHGAYHVTLHPENGTVNLAASDNIMEQEAALQNSQESSVHIGLYPDAESLSNNIETFVDGYNRFLTGVIGSETDDNLTGLLSKDIQKFLGAHSASLEKYGISVNDDSTLNYEKNDEVNYDSSIKTFGMHILRKLNSIALDPMEYIDRRICAYPNPNASYPNPYVTSIYTGMLFNTYT